MNFGLFKSYSISSNEYIILLFTSIYTSLDIYIDSLMFSRFISSLVCLKNLHYFYKTFFNLRF